MSAGDAVGGESGTGPALKGFTLWWSTNKYVEGGDLQMEKLRPREGKVTQISDVAREQGVEEWEAAEGSGTPIHSTRLCALCFIWSLIFTSPQP